MPARVLVVDDNVDMVETMTTLLQLEGCEAKGCLFATEALHYVLGFQPEVVLLDIRMPGKSGFDVADEIREAFPRKRPLLIGITGERLDGEEPRVKTFDQLLRKPVDVKALLALIGNLRT